MNHIFGIQYIFLHPIESNAFWILIRHPHIQGHKSILIFLLFALSQHLKALVAKPGTPSCRCVYKHAHSHPKEDQKNSETIREEMVLSSHLHTWNREQGQKKKQNNESVMDWHCIRLCNCKILHASQWRNLPIFNLK